jgi:hypothetical protein
MHGMAKIASVCLIAGASLLVWAEGAGGGSKAPSVRLPGAAFAALETINPEHIRCPYVIFRTIYWRGVVRDNAAGTSRRNTSQPSLPNMD